jgi:hypothetical protein
MWLLIALAAIGENDFKCANWMHPNNKYYAPLKTLWIIPYIWIRFFFSMPSNYQSTTHSNLKKMPRTNNCSCCCETDEFDCIKVSGSGEIQKRRRDSQRPLCTRRHQCHIGTNQWRPDGHGRHSTAQPHHRSIGGIGSSDNRDQYRSDSAVQQRERLFGFFCQSVYDKRYRQFLYRAAGRHIFVFGSRYLRRSR